MNGCDGLPDGQQKRDFIWVGDVVDGSCGREVRGTRQPTQGEPTPFVLTKQ